jgi:hypothetical protein
MKRGPKSTAELTVVKLDSARPRARIPIPKYLTGKPERDMFAEVVANHRHLTIGDTEQITLFVISTIGALKLSKKTDVASVKATNLKTRDALAAARGLRITQISQSHPETLARKRSNAAPTSYF